LARGEPAAPESTAGKAAESDPDAIWRQVQQEGHQNPRLSTVIDHLTWDQRLDGPSISLSIDDASMVAFAKTSLGALERLFAAAIGRPIKVELVVSAGSRDVETPKSQSAASAAEYEAAAQIPLVRKAMDLLDARIVGVESAPPPRRSD
jgi:hypothetical protein